MDSDPFGEILERNTLHHTLINAFLIDLSDCLWIRRIYLNSKLFWNLWVFFFSKLFFQRFFFSEEKSNHSLQITCRSLCSNLYISRPWIINFPTQRNQPKETSKSILGTITHIWLFKIEKMIYIFLWFSSIIIKLALIDIWALDIRQIYSNRLIAGKLLLDRIFEDCTSINCWFNSSSISPHLPTFVKADLVSARSSFILKPAVKKIYERNHIVMDVFIISLSKFVLLDVRTLLHHAYFIWISMPFWRLF